MIYSNPDCGQMDGCIKMPLGMEVGLGPGHIVVRWGPSSPPQKTDQSPHFRSIFVVSKRLEPPQFSAHLYCGQMAEYIKMPLDMEVGLSPGDFVLAGDPAPTPNGAERPSIFGPRRPVRAPVP